MHSIVQPVPSEHEIRDVGPLLKYSNPLFPAYHRHHFVVGRCSQAWACRCSVRGFEHCENEHERKEAEHGCSPLKFQLKRGQKERDDLVEGAVVEDENGGIQMEAHSIAHVQVLLSGE